MAGHRAREVAIAALAIAVTVGAGAQDAPQPAPTFRSEINFVQIPVRVLDARGESATPKRESVTRSVAFIVR